MIFHKVVAKVMIFLHFCLTDLDFGSKANVINTNRVTTCLENLEMSGILRKVRKVSGKKYFQGKVA